MRVGINAIALLSPLTGVGQYTRSLITALGRHEDADLRFFYGRGWSTALRSSPLDSIESWKRLVKKYVPRPYEVTRAAQQVAFSIGSWRNHLDLYHEPSFLAFRFDGPTVSTVHDLSWIRFPGTHPADRVAALNSMLPESLARSAHVITDAEYVRREVIDTFGVSADRITAIPLAARSEFHPRNETECRATMQARDLRWRQFLLSVGTLEPRKNLGVALTAYATLPPALRKRFPLVIVGMRGWLDAGVERSIEPLIAAGSIRLFGYVSDSELAHLYAGARMLIYPSLYEGFGLPPLEAMASGTPVVASNASTLPEVVGAAGCLVDPHDVDALKQNIQLLLEDESAWQHYQQAGLERALCFSWQRCAEQTSSVYRRVFTKRT